MSIHARRFALLAALAGLSCGARAQSHLELVKQTPCLYEYRDWVVSRGFVRQPHFLPPAGLTAEQCSRAIEIHEKIQQEQAQARRFCKSTPKHPMATSKRRLACWNSVFG